MKKRILALVLAVCLVVGMVPLEAAAAESDFVIENGVLKKYTGPGGNVVIPDGVTTIDIGAFSSCVDVKAVKIPNSVSQIKRDAFSGCTNLTTVNIPKGITEIPDSAFYNCTKLSNIALPDGITTIEFSAFSGCSSLTSIILPDGLTTILGGAFVGCGLTAINIPATVSTIGGDGSNPFGGCESLASITVDSNNQNYYVENGVLFERYKDSVSLICYLSTKTSQDYTVPNGTTYISSGAFMGCRNLTNIIIPGSVGGIGNYSFSGCTELISLTISKSITAMGLNTFEDCSKLRDVYYSGTVDDWYSIELYVAEIGETYENGPIKNAVVHCTDGEVKEEAVSPAAITALYPENGKVLDKDNPESGTSTTNYADGKLRIFFDKQLKNAGGNRPELDTGVGTLEIHRASDDAVVYQIKSNTEMPFWGENGVWDKAVRLDNATAALDYDTEYYVTMPAGFIQFADGSASPAIAKGQWGFRTASAPVPDIGDDQNEISTIDLLALSLLSYEEPNETPQGKTVRELIDYKWNQYWDDNWMKVNIRNRELFMNLADWKVFGYREDGYTGFAAYIFYHDSNFVIAYRGSRELTLSAFWDNPWDWLMDWIANDIGMFIGKEGSQVKQAFEAYESINGIAGTTITVTGHSLGGGLADIVAARYGCKGESFNSAPFLDIAYGYYPELMAELFDGTDAFAFTSHANKSDAIGNYAAEQIKPLWLYRGNGLVRSDHSLASLVTKDVNGSPKMLEEDYKRPGSEAYQSVKSYLGVFNDEVALGTSGDNRLKGFNPAATHIALGGAGIDNIYTNIRSDTISGGKGDDILDGSWGNDKYIYYKGHGVDTIHDTSGKDTLSLYGFSASDRIQVEEGDDTYAYITVNGRTIVKIAKRRSNPMTSLNNSFTVSSNQGFERNIEDYLKDKRNFFERLSFSCPVNVEIVNETTGKVVYTLADQKEETSYTEYGNFYVLKQENGEYTKIVDLIQGYSARVVGTGDGKMDAAVFDTDGFNLSEPYAAQNVSVTKGMVATVEEATDGKKNLVIDIDADGQPDVIVPMTTNMDTPSIPPAAKYYEITTPTTQNGTVTATPQSSCEGGTVTITATPDAGYQLDMLTVKDSAGSEITLTDQGSGKYTFTMPASKVSISAAFKPLQTEHKIQIDRMKNGVVMVEPKLAIAGEEITLTVQPDAGCQLVKLTALDKDGKEISMVNPAESKFTFIMPDSDVTIQAEFKAVWKNPYSDVSEKAWYYGNVRYVTEQGIMHGYDNGKFGPDDELNRAQMTQLLYNKEGKPGAPANTKYNDVTSGSWYAQAVAWADSRNIVNGYGAGKFGPSDPITREQLAAILYRYAGSPKTNGKLDRFSDAEEVSAYAADAMRWAVESGLVKGSGDSLNPKGRATRKEVAAIMQRYLEG